MSSQNTSTSSIEHDGVSNHAYEKNTNALAERKPTPRSLAPSKDIPFSELPLSCETSPYSSARERLSRLSRSVPTTPEPVAKEIFPIASTPPTCRASLRGHSRAQSAFSFSHSKLPSTTDSQPYSHPEVPRASSYPPLHRPPLSNSKVPFAKEKTLHSKDASLPLKPLNFNFDGLRPSAVKKLSLRKQRSRQRRSGSAQLTPGEAPFLFTQNMQEESTIKPNSGLCIKSTTNHTVKAPTSLPLSSHAQNQLESSNSVCTSSVSNFGLSSFQRSTLGSRSKRSRPPPTHNFRFATPSHTAFKTRIRSRNKRCTFVSTTIPALPPKPDIVNVSLTVDEIGKVQVHIVLPGAPLYVPRSPTIQARQTSERSVTSLSRLRNSFGNDIPSAAPRTFHEFCVAQRISRFSHVCAFL